MKPVFSGPQSPFLPIFASIHMQQPKDPITFKGRSYYTPAEERLNVASHGLGFLAACVGCVLMVRQAWVYGEGLHLLSAAVFGVCMMLLYAASTLYHSAKPSRLRFRLRVFDHVGIFLLIGGSYTPFTLLVLPEKTGWAIFVAVWSCALVGIVLKLFFTGRYDRLSTLMYIATGWIIVLAIGPLIRNLPEVGMQWVAAGGLSYTVGAVLYSINRLPFNHAIFHFFVLGGTFCHFWAVYYYVLPWPM
jgi:hemolysin III